MSNKEIIVTFPDGQSRPYAYGTTSYEVASSLSQGLARRVLVSEVNDQLVDLDRPLNADCRLRLLDWESEAGKATFWHSTAHVMAEALESLYPGIQFGIGPPIEQGFYYDVDFGDQAFSSEDVMRLETRIRELAQQSNHFARRAISKADALSYFEKKGDRYKLELLEDLQDGDITFYTQGNFTDLCRGPHIPHTGFIKAVKIVNIAAAYWRGEVKNKQLTRLYGISFPSAKELKAYLARMEAAKARDHRRIGVDLGLFAFSPKVGAGLPLWLPKGTIVREVLQRFLQKAQHKQGYQSVITPHIGRKELYETSGHYDKYGADSFRPITTPHEETFLLKPMNCPHHCEIYASQALRSYRELPLRLAEFGTVYRYEQSGELQGLTRVRGFTQDDAHIFCTQAQLQAEFEHVIALVLFVFKTLGFHDYKAQISLRDPEKSAQYIGSDAAWALAESAIIEAARAKGIEAREVKGEAAFYGPKLDFMVRDVLEREWQLGTIQIDYQLPERFDLNYIDEQGAKQRPVMIHRAPFGSMERFVALLIEQCEGYFPAWLAPTQFVLLPLSENFIPYANGLKDQLDEKGIRAHIDVRNEKLNRKIRDAEIQKIPFMGIVGEKEAQSQTLALRIHKKGNQGVYTLEALWQKIGAAFSIPKWH